MNFVIGRCDKCGRDHRKLMYSNNPILPRAICFDCLNSTLNPENLEHADLFCRTYNIPFDPTVWLQIAENFPKDQIFEQYTTYQLEAAENQPNLVYSTSTKDLWARTNKEWEKTRSFTQILNRLGSIRESYIERGRLKWGEQYTFEDIIQLDAIYVKTLKANRITNPLQKEAVKTLCKLQIEMNEAIRAKDAKAMKDFSTAYSTFAKQADLETMINETKTDDITTVAELYQYIEDSGFQMKFYDGAVRDEIDMAIKDIKEANRKLILEATGLQAQLEDMIKQAEESREQAKAQEITSTESLQDLLDFHPEDAPVDVESDDEALDLDFAAEQGDSPDQVKIVRQEDKA